MKKYLLILVFCFFVQKVKSQNKNFTIVIQDKKCCDYTERPIVICDTTKIKNCLGYKDSIYIRYLTHTSDFSYYSIIYHLDSSLIQDSIYNKFLSIPLLSKLDSSRMYQKVTTYSDIRVFYCNTQVNRIQPNLYYCETLFNIIGTSMNNKELSERLRSWIDNLKK
jgi:hypothetical protein